MRNILTTVAVTRIALAATMLAAALSFAPAAFAQTCAYNSTQGTCACPVSSGGTTCFGGQLYRSTDGSCQPDPRPGANATQVFNCSSVSYSCNTAAFPCGGCTAATSTIGAACGSPNGGTYTNQCGSCSCGAGKTLCAASNTCVNTLACGAGTTFDPCTNSCSTPNVLKDQAVAQTGYINITGDLKSTAGDYYLANGKAIRVDGAGATSLNIGNWGGGATGFAMNVFGTLSPTAFRLPTGAAAGRVLTSDASGNASWQVPPATGVTGSGTANTLAKFTAATAVGNSLATDTGAVFAVDGNVLAVDATTNRVGVNTLTPGYALDVTAGGVANQAVARLHDNNVAPSWVGTRLDRNGNVERWFVGMTNADNSYRIRRDAASDAVVIDGANNMSVAGTVIAPSLRVTTAAAAGRILTSDASGNATWQAPAASGVGGSGTTNYLPRFSAAATLANSQVFDNGTNVGIGNAAPGTKLDVTGTVRATGLVGGTLQVTGGTPAVGRVLTSDASGNATWQAPAAGGIGGSGAVNRVPKFTAASTLGSSTQIIEVGNNVGIGTATPQTLLSVGATAGAPNGAFGVSSAGDMYTSGTILVTGLGTSTFFSGVQFNGQPTFGDSTGDQVYFFGQRARVNGLLTFGDNFVTNNTLAVDVVNRRVGVNTAAPGTTLDVAGVARVTGFVLPTGAAAGRVLTSDASGNATWQAAAAGGIGGSGSIDSIPKFTAAGVVGNSIAYELAYGPSLGVSGRIGAGTNTPRMTITATGATLFSSATVGALTSGDTAWNYLSSGTSGGTDSSHIWKSGTSLRFATDGPIGATYSEKMRITSAGRLGIGTAMTAPDGQVQIDGPINAAYNAAELIIGSTGAPHLGLTDSQINSYSGASAGLLQLQANGGATWVSGPLSTQSSVSLANNQLSIPGSDTIGFHQNRAKDNAYEWLGLYSGVVRQGIIIYDGNWDGCATPSAVCIKAENGNSLALKGDGGITAHSNFNMASGDVYLKGRNALQDLGDGWLRLNQNGNFWIGTHTPGLFAPGSLNVGGAIGWGNPGQGNIITTGQIELKSGSTGAAIVVNGSEALWYDGWTYSWGYGGGNNFFADPITTSGLSVNGTTVMNGALYVASYTVQKWGGGSWDILSDSRVKKDVHAFEDGLQTVREIDPKWFTYNGLAGSPEGLTSVGVIAQQVKEVAPYMVTTVKQKLHPEDATDTDIYSFNASALPFINLNAIKELDARTLGHEEDIETLREEMKTLKARIEELEKSR